MKCKALWIDAIVYEYRLSKNLEYAIKLLTFFNEKFCSEMLATHSLVRIDMGKQKIINYELYLLDRLF